jgi:hypothetical protein
MQGEGATAQWLNVSTGDYEDHPDYNLDVTGAGNGMTQDTLNGQPAWRFAGNASTYVESSVISVLPNEFTVFYVVQHDADSTGGNTVWSDVNSANRYAGITNVEEFLAIRTSTNFAELPGAVRGETYLVFNEFKLNNTVRIPGVGEATDPSTGSTSQMDWGQVGSYYQGGLPFDGLLACLGLYLGLFNEAERTNITNWAHALYKVAI